MNRSVDPVRRSMLAAFAASLFTTRGLFAEELSKTPWLEEGPFYPDRLPLDADNDLIQINDHITPAVGEVTHLTGRVLNASGEPMKNALIEIWQCDAKAVYLHTRDSVPKESQRDGNFQGFGRFETDSTGKYYFRTIKPVAYSGREAPHIHFKVKASGKELLTTQMLIRGYPGNERDNVFRRLRDPKAKELLLVDFKPMENSKVGELAANFDIVLGSTPDENSRRPRRPPAPPPPR